MTALDHFVWHLDLGAQQRYWRECRARGEPTRPYEEVPGLWHPRRLPGKRGFDLAHRALRSRVRAVVGDWMAVDLARLGQFDVTLFLGVLYHQRHPLLALERLAAVTGELAIIETDALADEGPPMLEFFPGAERNHDASNWWAPNRAALEAMCLAAGFASCEVVAYSQPEGCYRRLTAQARK